MKNLLKQTTPFYSFFLLKTNAKENLAVNNSVEKVSEKPLKKETEESLVDLKSKTEISYLAGESLKVDGVGNTENRLKALENNFDSAKESYTQHQEDVDRLYLGNKDFKAFFQVWEKHLGRTFDSRKGMIGAVGGLLGLMKASYNPSLEKKMYRKCGITPENFRKIHQKTIRSLEENKDVFDKLAAEEQKEFKLHGKKYEQARRQGEYKTLVSDILVIGTSLGLSALQVGSGVTIPLTYVSPRRKAFALDTNAAIAGIREGKSYTEVLSDVSQDTEKSIFMMNNLLKNRKLLANGPKYLEENPAEMEQKWNAYEKLKSHLSFDKAATSNKNMVDKNFYQSLGFEIENNGALHLKEAKKFRKIFYELKIPGLLAPLNIGITEAINLFRKKENRTHAEYNLERWTTDRKENRKYKKMLKVLKAKPKKSWGEAEVVSHNRDMAEAIKTITNLMEHELNEDLQRKRNKNNPTKKLEGEISAYKEMKRFSAFQNSLVNTQEKFYRIKNIDSSRGTETEQKSEILYKTSMVAFLSGFNSAKEVFDTFPVVLKRETQIDANGKKVSFVPVSEKNRKKEVEYIVQDYFQRLKAGGDTKGLNNKILNIMTENKNFTSWIQTVGKFVDMMHESKCYMPVRTLNEFSDKNINTIADENIERKEYDSSAAVAPRGQGGGIPLFFSTAWIDGNFLNFKNSDTNIPDGGGQDIPGTGPRQTIQQQTQTVNNGSFQGLSTGQGVQNVTETAATTVTNTTTTAATNEVATTTLTDFLANPLGTVEAYAAQTFDASRNDIINIGGAVLAGNLAEEVAIPQREARRIKDQPAKRYRNRL